MKSNDYNQAGSSAKQSLVDIFVDNQQKLMAQLEGLFTFEPKFVKLPTMGEQRFSDFESPTVDQLKLYPLKKEIKLCQIGFKTNGMNLSGIQLMFTNGVETPLFEAANAVNKELQTFDIDITKRIKKIGILVSNSNYIFGIKFIDEKNREILDEWWQMDNDNIKWYYQTIPDGQEIIGLYGNKTISPYSIKQLGFVLWKPNPVAEK